MGIQGLTTFIESLKDSYKTKIYIRDEPVVIDACNLMYFLYFEGNNSVVDRGPKKPDNAKKLPFAHLFAGDWEQYAQNVRYFFQQLKQCNITPIVIFDGAYGQAKLEVARTRFAKNVYENVKKRSAGSIEYPGKSYTPIFLKTVFMEVVAEQKISCYQTISEADPTIAFVANLLQRCPILSSDSDFYIYPGGKPIPLNTLKFAKAVRGRKGYVSTENPRNAAEKVWTLQGEYVSLPDICKKEFHLKSSELIGLAAFILGNDTLPFQVMREVKHFKLEGSSTKSRIESVLKYLGRFQTAKSAIIAITARARPDKKDFLISSIENCLRIYNGESGEIRIWQAIKREIDLSEWTNKELEIELEKGGDSVDDLGDAYWTRKSSEVVHVVFDADDDPSSSLPIWFKEKHISCELQTYLFNIVRNKIVFLTPQVEMCGSPSTHELSVPIIKVTAGILDGLTDKHEIELVSVRKGNVSSSYFIPEHQIRMYGRLPLLLRSYASLFTSASEYHKLHSHETRMQIMLAALGICENEPCFKCFEGWPASYRIWIGTLLYYIKKKLVTPDETRDPIKCLAILTAIYLCIIKNLLVNPSKLGEAPSNKCLSAIQALHKVTSSDPIKLQQIRKFYSKFEDFSEVTGSKFMKNYDIAIPYSLSQYLCIVYHTEMLNNLLANPMRSPKVRYTINNFFVYQFAHHIISELDKKKVDRVFNDIITEATGVQEIDEVLFEFLGVCYGIDKFVPGEE